MNFFLHLIKCASFATCSKLNNNINPGNSVVITNNVNPVIRYLDADLYKLKIIEDNRNKSGIYRWVNNINNKTYIGSSINLSERMLDYYSSRILLKYKTHIHNALIKHGYSNFSLEILEYCKKEETILREQYYIDLLKPVACAIIF